MEFAVYCENINGFSSNGLYSCATACTYGISSLKDEQHPYVVVLLIQIRYANTPLHNGVFVADCTARQAIGRFFATEPSPPQPQRLRAVRRSPGRVRYTRRPCRSRFVSLSSLRRVVARTCRRLRSQSCCSCFFIYLFICDFVARPCLCARCSSRRTSLRNAIACASRSCRLKRSHCPRPRTLRFHSPLAVRNGKREYP